MLKTKDNKTKLNTIYICDRCKRETCVAEERTVGIYTRVNSGNTNIKKRWDLCGKCFSALVRGIEKGGIPGDKR